MGKIVSFEEKDAALIEKIEQYQENEGISFEKAVKELCNAALEGFVWGEIEGEENS